MHDNNYPFGLYSFLDFMRLLENKLDKLCYTNLVVTNFI